MNSPGAPKPAEQHCLGQVATRPDWRRRPYLDWLRGIAVLIMIEAHTLDSWTQAADVMGVSMLAGALGWSGAATPKRRMALFAVATVVMAMLTPLIRVAAFLDSLPGPVEAYFRPVPGLTNFTLFPWAGFFSAGCAVGVWLDARQARDDGRLIRWLAVAGVALVLTGYGSSFLPPLYAQTSFWTSSPTFFFLRLGVLLLMAAAAYAMSRVWNGLALQQFGRASLFVYWIHVELVYGVLTAPIHRQLPFPVALIAFAVFAAAMFGLVRLKELLQRGRPTKGLEPSPSSLSAGRGVSGNSI